MNSLPSAEEGPPDEREIASALQHHGQYVTRVDARRHQQMADLHWTAHRAGRLLGIKVRVFVEGPSQATEDRLLTVTVSRRA